MIDRFLGAVLVVTALGALLREWVGGTVPSVLAVAGLVVFLVTATPTARWSRKAFVATGALLLLVAVALRPDWPSIAMAALEQGAFIAAFFIALASLRNPASTSPAIERCGQYLASQPPGKRYLALTTGGHLFSLILSYGAINLLGGLTESIASREPNAEIREIRNRRMLLAIQRGFVASLTWSPLAFAMAITTSIIPGSSWGGAAGIAIVNAFLVSFVGWSLDTLYKPKLSGPPPPRQPASGSWRDLKPLLVLLVLLFSGVAILEAVSGLRIIAIVMLLVPIISIGWVIIQTRGATSHPSLLPPAALARLRDIAFVDIPSYRSELLLLVMAGVIGSVGGALLKPLTEGFALDAAGVPAWVILVALVWLIPLAGQLGMNPILSVSLLAPLLPSPEALRVSPNVVVVALTAGWALTGASSPFTATTLLIGRLGHTTALKVGLVWNRGFMIAAGLAVSATVAAAALLL